MDTHSFPIVIKQKLGSSERDEDISIPKSILKKISPTSLPTHVRAGLIHLPASCTVNNTNQTVLISAQLLQKLGIPDGTHCHLLLENDTLRLGPIIGVFVGKKYILKLKEQQARERSIELFKANHHAKTILYFFCIQGVDNNLNKVEGYYLDRIDNRWKRHSFPFPDVLYDRGSGKPNKRLPLKTFRRKIEQEPLVKKINAQHF